MKHSHVTVRLLVLFAFGVSAMAQTPDSSTIDGIRNNIAVVKSNLQHLRSIKPWLLRYQLRSGVGEDPALRRNITAKTIRLQHLCQMLRRVFRRSRPQT